MMELFFAIRPQSRHSLRTQALASFSQTLPSIPSNLLISFIRQLQQPNNLQPFGQICPQIRR
jgi:hypothetical protein